MLKRIFLLLFLPLFIPSGIAQRLVPVGMGYSGTSVNTTIFRNNSLVTHEGVQFIAYYDSVGYITLGKRKGESMEWELHRTQYKGNIADAHNSISIMVDGAGFLHMAFDHHGDTLNYCRGLNPLGLNMGEKIGMVGRNETDVTYPEFYRLADGDLLFAYREGRSGRGNLVLNRYSLSGKVWKRVADVVIDGEKQRNAYWQLFVDKTGVIHLSWVWRESWLVETNHDLCYACSRDKGVTWLRSDGTPYEMPITVSNAEYACRIPQNSELINQTSMSADESGHPYIATYWRDRNSDVPQYRMVFHDGTRWRQSQIGNRKRPFSLTGGGTKMIPIARPRIVIHDSCVWMLFRDEERDSRVSVAYNSFTDPDTWSVKDLTAFPVGAWEPSFDTELWKNERQLHIFVQQTRQGDGEKTVANDPQPVYVLELDMEQRTDYDE